MRGQHTVGTALPDRHTAPDTIGGRMLSFPTLLCSCIVSMITLGHGLPLPPDAVKNFVKGQADNISARIQKHKDEMPIFHKMLLNNPELLPEIPSNKPIEGLSSVVETLSLFQKVLHSLPKGYVSQLHADVSTLQGYLEDRMKSLQCAYRKTGSEKSLEAFLKDFRTYHVTLGHVALDRLQKYLQKLTQSLDQLKTC
ncbi:hypothetical protein NFI96_029189 [Prochilodus magdalenae]|nr:hypothetical protein NFI96_029189 [Prochilodus magdalenae]